MNTQQTKEENILRRYRPAALQPGAGERLLSAMMDTARKNQIDHPTASTIRQQAQPAPLPRQLHTRLLAAMLSTAARPGRKWYSYRRTAVAGIALLLLFAAWLSSELLFTQNDTPIAATALDEPPCFAIAERSILPANSGSHHCLLRDTLTLQEGDTSTISVRVSSSIPAPIPDDVI